MKKIPVILLVFVVSLSFCLSMAFAKTTEIEFLIGGWEERYKAVESKIIPEFEKDNPDIKVKLIKVDAGTEAKEKLLTMIAGGLAPDIAFIRGENAYAFYRNGTLAKLDGFMERDNFNKDILPKNAIPTLTYKGSFYGMPYDGFGFNVETMYVNKDLFAEAGVEVPQADPRDPYSGWTYDDLLEMAYKLTKDTDGDGRLDQWAVQFQSWWPGAWMKHVWSFGGRLINDERTKIVLNQPEAVRALQLLSDLINKYGVSPKPEMIAGLGDVQATGKIAMWDSALAKITFLQRAKVKFDWTVVPMPRGPAGRIGIAGVNIIGILASSKHKEAAWKFIRHWLSEESQRYLALETMSYPPQITTVAESPDFLRLNEPPYTREPFVYGVARVLPNDVPQWLKLQDLMQSEIELMLLGKKTAQEAADKIVANGSKYLK